MRIFRVKNEPFDEKNRLILLYGHGLNRINHYTDVIKLDYDVLFEKSVVVSF